MRSPSSAPPVNGLEERRRAKRTEQVVRVVSERLHASLWSEHGYHDRVQDFLDRGTAPYDVAERILTEVLGAITERAGDEGRSASLS